MTTSPRGHLTVGIGPGWPAEEFDLVGAPAFSRRGEVTDECMALFRELGRRRNRTSAAAARPSTTPWRCPAPPSPVARRCGVGGHSDAALRQAALLGDAWFPLGLIGVVGLTPLEPAAAGRQGGAAGVAFTATVRFDAPAGCRWLATTRRSLAGWPPTAVRMRTPSSPSWAGDLSRQLEHMERLAVRVAPLVDEEAEA